MSEIQVIPLVAVWYCVWEPIFAKLEFLCLASFFVLTGLSLHISIPGPNFFKLLSRNEQGIITYGTCDIVSCLVT